MRGRDVLEPARVPSLLSRLARSWATLGGWYSELDDAQVSKRKNDDDNDDHPGNDAASSTAHSSLLVDRQSIA